MSSETYRYNIVISASLGTRGVKASVDSAEQQLTRLEKRALKLQAQYEKLSKAIDAVEKAGSITRGGTRASLPNIATYASPAIKQAQTAGREIASGLATGLRAGLSQAQSVMRTLTSGLISQAKISLGIRSPSTVFFQIGKDIVSGLTGGIRSGTGAVASAGSSLFAAVVGGNLVATAISFITSKVAEGAKVWLDYSSKIEQAKIGFTTMTGSADIAQRHLEDLQTFAAKTPFQFEQLVDASQKLQGVGVSAERVIPILKDVGNSLAAAGRLDELPIAIKALGDIQAKGKLAGQEIIQLANAGIPIREVLAKQLGKTQEQVIELGEKGAISAELVFDALHKMSEERFGDAMQKQSRTFSGALSNISDQLKISASKAFQPLFDKISRLAIDMADEVQAKGDDFEAVGQVMAEKIVAGLGMVLASAVPALIKGLANPRNYAAIASGMVEAAGGTSRSDFEKSAMSNMTSLNSMTLQLSRNDDVARQFNYNSELTQGENIRGMTQAYSDARQKLIDAAKNDPKLMANLKTELQKLAEVNMKNLEETLKLAKSDTARANIQATIDSVNGSANRLNKEVETLSQNVSNVPSLADQLKAKEALELTKALAEANRKLTLSQAENKFNITRARIALRPEFTDADRIANVRAQSSAQAAFIRAQIDNQVKGFDEEIKLNADSKEKVGKLQIEKNEVLGKLNTDLVINTLTTQKQIQDIQLQSYERQRQTALQFQRLMADATRQNQDRILFEIEKGIASGAITAEAGFQKQIDVANAAYQALSRINKEQFSIQLQDQRLTAGERANITLEMYQEEQRLAQENAETIFRIEQQRLQQQRQLISEYNDFAIQSAKSANDFVTSGAQLIFGDRSSGARSKALLNSLTGAAKQQIDALRDELADIHIAARQMLMNAEAEQTGGKVFSNAGELKAFDPFSASPHIDPKILNEKQYATFSSLKVTAQQIDEEIKVVEEARDRLAPLYAELKQLRKDFVATPEGVDQHNTRLLKQSQDAEMNALALQIRGQEQIVGLKLNDLDATREQQKLDGLREQQRVLAIKNLGEQEKAYRESIQGIKAYNRALAEGDHQAVAFVQNQAIKDQLNDEAGLRQQIITLQTQSADLSGNRATIENLRIQFEYLQDIAALREREVQAIIETNRIQLELSRKGEYSKIQSDVQVLQHINEQTKSLTDSIADFKIALADGFFQAVDSPFAALEKRLEKLPPLVRTIASSLLNLARDIIKAFSQKLILKLLGLDSSGGTGSTSGSGGGIFDGIISGIQRIFSGIFNPASRGTSSGTGATSSSGAASRMMATASSLGANFGKVEIGEDIPALTTNARATPLGGAARAAASGLPAGAQAMLDVNTSSSTGDASAMSTGRGGQIIQTAGGALSSLGALFMSSGPAMAFTFAAQMFMESLQTHSPTVGALKGGLVGMIAGFLNRNKRRKREEKLRSTALLDAFSAMDKLIADVNADKIDGESALSQANTIRQNYLDQMNQLKDKKTRNHALADVSRIDQKISALRGAITAQGNRQARMAQLTPTFADGGATSRFIGRNYRHNPLGYISGPGNSRSDSIPAYFPAAGEYARISDSEYVLDAVTTRNIGIDQLDAIRADKGRNFRHATNVMKRMKSPGRFADGGAVGQSGDSGFFSTPASGGNGASVSVEVHNTVYPSEGGATVETEVYLRTPKGKELIEKIVEEKIYENKKSGRIPKALAREFKNQ